jgi:hypothetical protein
MHLFNQYSTAVTGMIFEILGSFLLAFESFGPTVTNRFLKRIVNFSKWIRSNFLRLTIFCLILLSPMISQIFYVNKVVITLLLPIEILILLTVLLTDHAKAVETTTMHIVGAKKITPIGFIMLLIGNLFLLYSIIVQIK